MLLLSLSLAQTGWYNPDAVAGSSETFKRFSDAVQPKSEDMESSLARASLAIQELDLGVTLLGDRSPSELVAYRDELRKQYAHQGLEAQSFSDWFQDTSSSVFMQALDFAVEDLEDWEVSECAPRSGGIAGMTGPSSMGGGVKCEGEDLSELLGTALDGNKDLNGVVDQLLSETWPTVKLSGQQWAPVALSGTQGYLRVAPLAEALIGDRLDALATELDRALGPLERELESGDAERALKDADKLRRAYEKDLAAEGDRLFDALEKVTRDWELGLCANPPDLGGCSGEDRTKALVPELAQNKKVLKALK